MIFGFFFARRDPNEFVADRYGPTERRRIELRKRDRWWRKHLAWLGRWPLPARVVLVLLEVTVCYLALVFGGLFGLAARLAFFG